MNKPTSSHTSAPSKLPIVTSKELLFFLIQAVLLSKRRDFLECIIMSMSRSVMVVNCLAKLIASVRSFSVMEG